MSCFCLILCYFKSFIKGGRWKAIFFVLSSSSSEKLVSEKSAICNHQFVELFVGLFQEDRRILVMKMEVGKAVYLAYSIF